ncbi:MAG: Gfo/Idh/MocA family oxidoreductase [Bacteroidota bacterium]|nr:Gfo/Idh/MocA family oxidoreductase [Bacteroidota bacterium]
MLPIKTALCSFGMSGRLFHAPFLHLDPDFELWSVWERNKELAAAIYPSIRTRRSLDDLLNDEAVDLVIVNTPNYTHFDFARQALSAGKHVVVEKPFTVTAAEAEELRDLAERKGKLLSVYQNRRYDSDYRTVRQVLSEGLLGDIVEAGIHYDRFNPALSPKTHKETPGPGTGVVYDLGSHLIDQALQLFGTPDALFADLRITRPASQVEDYMEIILYYPALRVRVKSGYFVREALPSYAIHGMKGSFIKARTDVQERDLQAGRIPGGEDWGTEPQQERGLLHTEIEGKIIRETIPSLRGNYGDYYRELGEAIRHPHQKPVPVPAEDGIRTMRIIEAAYQSNREKRVIVFR